MFDGFIRKPSRHDGRVQWVFSPPVHCLRTREFLTQGYTEGSILNIENSLFPYDNILPFLRFAERESIAGNSAGS